ncbi:MULTISPECIES: hypothetical protein [Halolamina]|uniref:Uncharacterized protein n=1 Tax=Halolamina pelagica TaxID=699431 RepID=A0A1I5WIC3_9EURY|nr:MULTISPECIES: hypothetical protein [Halolamina]NHX37566.1 hypothetical protein [Halolamina sp. R1-12]SFQ19391.1 hypothetical protein SAMN05216277_1318 [Halolamina pelagica]
MSNSYDDIQTRDRTDTATAAENLLKERVEHQLYQENLQIEAEVRSLISDAEAALVGQTDDDPESAAVPRNPDSDHASIGVVCLEFVLQLQDQ